MIVGRREAASVDETPAANPETVNILLVDDEPKNLKALEAVLSAADRRLMCAQSGDDALRWLLKERFAVVLLDVHMPDMDGFETAALMRQHIRSQTTPIIFLTAANKEEWHVSRGYSLGAVDYIFKPLDVSILRSKVAVFVELFRKTEQVRRQAEQLAEARGFLENILESAGDYAIIAQDLGGKVVGWYEGARQQYGYASEEMLSKHNTAMLFAGEDVESGRVTQLFETARRKGKAEGIFQQVGRDGRAFTGSVSVNLRRDAAGEVIGFVLVVKDITEQLRQEEQARLLVREQAARAEAEAANRRFALLAEASDELGRLLDGGSSLQVVAALATRGSAARAQDPQRHPEGTRGAELRPAVGRASVLGAAASLADACLVDLIDDNGEVVRAAAAHHDAAVQTRLRTVPAPDPDNPALVRAIGQGETTLVAELSGRAMRDLGRDAGERKMLRSIGFTSCMVIPIPGTSRGAGYPLGDSPGVVPTTVAPKPDTQRVPGRGYPLGAPAAQGAIWLFRERPDPYSRSDLGFAQDLARRIGLALDNVRLYREAQRAVEVREEFLSVASHELKTPVTSLRGQAQLMIRQLTAGRELDPDRLTRAFRVIDNQTHKLANLVHQLLDVSRLEAGKLVLERSSVDVAALVEDIVIRTRATVDTHDIAVHAPPHLVAEVDALRLEQVVTNLLDNAVKYSPHGDRVEVEVSLPSADVVRLSVRDWGPGIEPEHRPHIFDRFHQGPERDVASGMGLGLYISRQIVELHGGTIEVEFPADGGSRFVVVLPRQAGAAEIVAAPAQPV